MSAQLLFYKNATPISASRHKDLYVKAGRDYEFARRTNAVPVTVAEFPLAVAEYAIVFVGSDEALIPAVILGSEPDQNLYVRKDGTWDSRYVPAFVRRYPFIFAPANHANSMMLCVDEDFVGCNRDGRGERLFDADGERTSYLENVLNLQRVYHLQLQQTRLFCKTLLELDVLRPVQARLQTRSDSPRLLGGLRVIDRGKLKQLNAEQIHQLLRSDELEMAFVHLQSLANLHLVGERLPGFESEESEALTTGTSEHSESPQ